VDHAIPWDLIASDMMWGSFLVLLYVCACVCLWFAYKATRGAVRYIAKMWG